MQKKIWYKWAQLGIGIVVILAIFWLTPLVTTSAVHRFIESEHIHTDALFYTESPEVGAVEFDRKKQNGSTNPNRLK